MDAPNIATSPEPGNNQSGIFARHAPEYAAAGLVPFPAGPDKAPLVKSHLAFGPSTHTRLVKRFADANIGLALNPRHGRSLTVVDVDAHNPSDTAAVVAECVKVFGDTPVKISTPSGGAHLWYGGSNLGRRIRPLTGLPVDVLAGGVGIAPPSVKANGTGYAFSEGGLADVERLPNIPPERAAQLSRSKPVISPADTLAALDRRIAKVAAENAPAPSVSPPGPVPWEAMGEGLGRNDALFFWAKERVQAAADRETFHAQLEARNATCGLPLPGHEVERIAESLWRYREQGRVMRSGSHSVVLAAALLDRLSPDSIYLLCKLKAGHGAKGGRAFALSRAMAKAIGWTLPRWKRARTGLVEAGLLEIVHVGGRGDHDPPLARLRD